MVCPTTPIVLTLIRGDDANMVFTLTDGDGVAVDLSSIERADFTARSRLGEIHAIGQIGEAGQITVSLPHGHITIAGSYRADLQLTTFDGAVITPWLGQIRIIEDVTHND